MSGPRILIIECNPPDLTAAPGYLVADQFKAVFASPEPCKDYGVAHPYATNFETCSLGQFDSVVFTVSDVNWGVHGKESSPLHTVMEYIFKIDLPVWGSCNGMQLAAVVQGGAVRSSPNGLKVGVAKGIRKTEADNSDFALHGRTDIFAVLGVHHDEVDRLPIGAVHLAENDHSSIQSFTFRAEGIHFLGAQYHPKCSANTIAKSLREGSCIFSTAPTLIIDLKMWDSDVEAAKRLGITCDALGSEERTRELATWLIHVKDRISS